MNVSCQCGAITFKTPLPEPLAIYICHCLECRRQSSSAFGCSAIFPAFSLPHSTNTTNTFPSPDSPNASPFPVVNSRPFPLSKYSRPTSSGHILDCFFCSLCGTRVLHAVRDDKRNVVSVKGGCIEGLDWSKAKHIWTKHALIAIPEDNESWSEEPEEDNIFMGTVKPSDLFTDHTRIAGSSDEDMTDTSSELSGINVGTKMRTNWLDLRGSGGTPDSTDLAKPSSGSNIFDRPSGAGWV